MTYNVFGETLNLVQPTPSTMIHSILPVQFTCLTVFLHNLSPSPLWSTSGSGTLHFLSCLVLPYRAGSHVVSHNAEAT